MGILDLYAAQTGSTEPPLQTLPRTVGERVKATAGEIFAPDRYFMKYGALNDQWQRAVDELHTQTGERHVNPYAPATGQERVDLGSDAAIVKARSDRIIQASRAARETNPDLFDPENIDRYIAEEGNRRRFKAESYEGTGNGFVNFLASVGMSTAEPFNLLTLGVPASRLPTAAASVIGSTFLRSVGKEALLQAGVNAGAQVLTDIVDQRAGLGEIAGNAAIAATFGAALGGGARALHLKWLGLPEKVRADAPLEVKDAFKAIEVDAIYSGRNRLGLDPILHERMQERANDAILRGRPVDMGELSRNADSPLTALGTILRQQTDRPNIEGLGNALDRVRALPDSEIEPVARQLKPKAFAPLDRVTSELSGIEARLAEMNRELETITLADMADPLTGLRLRDIEERLQAPALTRKERNQLIREQEQITESIDPKGKIAADLEKARAELETPAETAERAHLGQRVEELKREQASAKSAADREVADLRARLDQVGGNLLTKFKDEVPADILAREFAPLNLGDALSRADFDRQARLVREAIRISAPIPPVVRVYRDLIATFQASLGLSQNEARANAAVFAARYEARAAGLPEAYRDAWDAYQKAGLKFERGEGPAGEGRTFNQSGKSGPDAPGVGVAKENVGGFWPALRVMVKMAKEKLPAKPMVLTGTNPKNAARQIAALDDLATRFKDPAKSVLEWSRMMAVASAKNDVVVPPYQFIREMNDPQMLTSLLQRLSAGQIADADHGFANAAKFFELYTTGQMAVEDTGKLMLWSFLSKGVSPYTQEAMFLDAFRGIDPFIKMAAEGKFDDAAQKAYREWAATIASKGEGKPGAGTAHNLNGFGRDFLGKMSQRGKDGRTYMQRLHDALSDPKLSGKDIRRDFHLYAEGVGIDNKVLSFSLLVTGRNDVMVLDRVQIRHLWDDGRFNGINLYDGEKVDGAPVAGSQLAAIGDGVRGLLVYEAIERSLEQRIKGVYQALGRPQDASVGRYHWDTWVADSGQEASHGSIDAVMRGALKHNDPLGGITAKEGRFDTIQYGARYGVDPNGVPYFLYPDSTGAVYTFDLRSFRALIEETPKRSSGVQEKGFKYGDPRYKDIPWFERPDVNREALDALVHRYGRSDEGGSVPGASGAALPDGAGPGRGTPDQVLNQDTRGDITFRENATIIRLLKGRDESTLIHEGFHSWVEEMRIDAAHPQASDQLKADFQTMMEFAGNKGEPLTREQHEKLARAGEAYMRTGEAPSDVLAQAFQTFKEWLTRIYRRMTDLDVKVSPEMKAVFDRMLATDAQLRERTAARLGDIAPEGGGRTPAMSSAASGRTYGGSSVVGDLVEMSDALKAQADEIAKTAPGRVSVNGIEMPAKAALEETDRMAKDAASVLKCVMGGGAI